MKKLLVLFFTTCATLWASAQTDPCQCKTDSIKHKVERFCSVGADQQGVYIAISYTEIRCGARVRYRVDNFHVATSHFNTTGDVSCPTTPAPAIGAHPITSTNNPYTNFGDPAVTERWFTWMQETIAALLPVGNNNGNWALQFSSGCMSLVPVKFPSNTIIYVTPGEGGGSAPVTVDLGDKINLVLMPCLTTECCIVEVNNDNGELTYTPLSSNGCDNAIIDYSKLPQITTTLPGGGTQTHLANIVGTPPPCQSMCRYNGSSMGAMVTDVSPIEQALKMEFAATPTWVQDAITFTTEVDITKVQVYDMQGKKVIDTPIENKQLLVSQLKEGVYFVQVHFTNKEVRTVKIYKK